MKKTFILPLLAALVMLISPMAVNNFFNTGIRPVYAQTESTESMTEATDSAEESTSSADQPVLPDELPQSGPEDWLKWIVSGMALIGIGLLLF